VSHLPTENAIAVHILTPDAHIPGKAGRSRGDASAGDGVTSDGQDLHVAALGVVVDLGDVLDEGGAVAAARGASRGSA